MNQILVPINLRSDYFNLLKYAISVSQRSFAHINLLYAGEDLLLKGTGNYHYNSDEELENLIKLVKGTDLRKKY